PSTSEIYTLSLHDALPICAMRSKSLEAYQEPLSARNVSLSLMIIAVFLYVCRNSFGWCDFVFFHNDFAVEAHLDVFVWPIDSDGDRKSTRLNSSHVKISYA